jgi:hypothetical protein
MTRHNTKGNPFLESMLNGAMLTQMMMPGQNAGRPIFLPGTFAVIPGASEGEVALSAAELDAPYAHRSPEIPERENQTLAP